MSIVPTRGEAAKSSRRKRKRTEEVLDPAERVRRQKQRQAQALALKLRAEGKDYRPPKKHKQPSNDTAKDAYTADTYTADAQPQKKARNGSAKHQPQGSQQEPYKEETGSRPEEDVQVIIVPIFWNKKADEKATVLAAAEEVQGQLQQQGITVGLDSTNADTPGQKYRYWEQKGVKVRIELGPRDAQKSQACLAISTTPGEVAKKSTFQIGNSLTEAVHKALAASGVQSKAARPNSTAQGGAGVVSTKTKSTKKQKQDAVSADSASEPVADVQTVGEEAAPVFTKSAARKASVKASMPSGDDLGDEFDVEIDAADDEGGKKKKRNKQSTDKTGPVVDAKAKRNKHKVVQF